MRVLLTGGYGCIGSWIVRNLLDRGDQVWVYDLREDTRRLRLIVPEGRLAAVPFVEGNVTDLHALRRAVALGRPFVISYGGRLDLQYADDVAKVFVRALEAPYEGAKSYNLRGAVVDLATFHRALCAVAPEAAELVTFGDRQLGIAHDLDDSALQRDLGPMPVTPLADGIRRTLEQFWQLAAEGRLDTADSEAPPPPVTAPADEP